MDSLEPLPSPFSPSNKALDLNKKWKFGKILRSPLLLGCWAMLEPVGIQNHAPQLCWITNKQLACVWMSGSQEGTAAMSIVISVLKDNSRSWSRPKVISQNKERSEQNPLLFLLEDDQLQLVHTSQESRSLNDNTWQQSDSTFSMQWTAKLRSQFRKMNGGRWTRASDLFPMEAFCRNPPYKRSDGCWLLPIYRSLEKGGGFGHDHSEVLLLDKNGNVCDEPIKVPCSKGRVHGSIVPSADGKSLLQFFRSRLADQIYRSIGSINGENWSIPESIDLPNNNSSIQAIRLKSGRLALVFNRFSFTSQLENALSWGEANWPRTRWPLSIAISEDDGKTWPWIRDIDLGEGFCGSANWHLNGQLAYPSLLEGSPGELHLAYSWGGRMAIRYVCLQEEEILGEWWLP